MYLKYFYDNIILKAISNKGRRNMKGRFSIKRILLIFTLSLFLAACGDESPEPETEDNVDAEDESAEADDESEGNELFDYEDFPQTVTTTGDLTGEGTLNVGYSSSTPCEGTLIDKFSKCIPDMIILDFCDVLMCTTDYYMQFTNDGDIHFDMHEEDNSVSFTVAYDVHWHDVEPLSIQDYVASYEAIRHPDYDGVT